jgi:hypothetical protein
MSEQTKSDFSVHSITTVKEGDPFYTHWAEGLTMYITKDGVTMKLNSEEIQKVVKALPRTIGGTY